jgi:hypothetical protein
MSIASLVAAGMPSSPPGSGSSIPAGEFRAVTALSHSDAWAVGDVDTGGPGGLHTLAVHWNGTRWVRVPAPSPGRGISGSTLSGVSAVSSADAWAVGGYETSGKIFKTLVVHWNGTRWAQVPSPNPGGTQGSGLSAVSASSPTDAWAVGGIVVDNVAKNLVVHWNGTRWAQVPSPSPGGKGGSGLSAVSAVSASDAWAVGCDGFNPNTGASGTLALHWDGTRWAQVATPNPGAAHSACLASVSALSATDAWAVGEFAPSPTSGAQKPLVLRWNGTRWAQVPTPAPGDTLVTELNGVAAVSPSDAWAVGDVFNGDTQTQRTLVFHWNGTRWARVPSPDSGGFNTLYGVSALTPSDAWTVGYGNNSLILHWNGSRWTES